MSPEPRAPSPAARHGAVRGRGHFSDLRPLHLLVDHDPVPTHSPTHPICLCIYQSIHPPIYPSIHLSLLQSVGRSVGRSVTQSLSHSVTQSLSQSVNQSISQSVRQAGKQNLNMSTFLTQHDTLSMHALRYIAHMLSGLFGSRVRRILESGFMVHQSLHSEAAKAIVGPIDPKRSPASAQCPPEPEHPRALRAAPLVPVAQGDPPKTGRARHGPMGALRRTAGYLQAAPRRAPRHKGGAHRYPDPSQVSVFVGTTLSSLGLDLL